MIYTQYIFLTDKWPQEIINLVSKVKATVSCSVVQRTVVNTCLKCCRRWAFSPHKIKYIYIIPPSQKISISILKERKLN